MTLADYLSRNGLTHGEFAVKAGIPRPTITRLVKPGSWPGRANMAAIHQATDGKVGPDDWAAALARAG